MKYVTTGIVVLVALCGLAAAQYDEVWETEIFDPQQAYLIDVAQTDSDPGAELVYIDNEYRTDQSKIIRILDARTGEEEWYSDEFYNIVTQTPNQPRLIDVDNDGIKELLMMVELDPTSTVWMMYKYKGNTGGKVVNPHMRTLKPSARRKSDKETQD